MRVSIKKLSYIPPKAIKEIAKKEKKLLLDSLRPLKGKRVALLLSGGADSIAIACALKELDIKAKAYSLTREDHMSTDFKVAKANAQKLGFEFKPVFIPVDLEPVKAGVLECIGLNLKKKSFIEVVWPMLLAYRSAKADGMEVVCSGEFGDAYFCNTRNFCIEKDKGSISDADAFREEYKYRYLESTDGSAQMAIEEDYAKSIGLRLVCPFKNVEFIGIYKGTSWKMLNSPFEKVPRVYAWMNYFKRGLDVRPSSNLQGGDSRINKIYEQLLDSDWNVGNWKSVIGIYNYIVKNGPPVKGKRNDMPRAEQPKPKTARRAKPKAYKGQAEGMPRYKRTKVCKECSVCSGDRCQTARSEKMRNYAGIRCTADGFDCALPVTIDSHSACSFGCLYCFSDNLWGHAHSAGGSVAGKGATEQVGQVSLKRLEAIFDGGAGKTGTKLRKALRYDKRNADGYPCPIQLGGLNDPMDNIERNQGWLLSFINLAIKYNQPVRISTKGDLFKIKEYRDAFAKAPHLFWVAFSIITSDDHLLEKIDLGAPNATERLKAMKFATDLGCSTSLRFRPLVPGVSDRTARVNDVIGDLVGKAAEAGAKAVSAEVIFYPGTGLGQGVQAEKFKQLQKLCGVPLEKVYRSFGKITACTRPASLWTENAMHRVRDEAHKHGMTLGVSDPVWKQLTDSGCCCGILPEDPVFGNWEVENATNALLLGKQAVERGEDFIITEKDIIPPWAYETLASEMCMLGTGPKTVFGKRHQTWADLLHRNYNDLTSDRGPFGYFQGALEPVTMEDGTLGYRYVGLKRQHPKNTPFWNV